MPTPEHQAANEMMDRLEMRFRPDPALRQRMLPLVEGIYAACPDAAQRRDFLRTLVEAYEHHVRARQTLEALQEKLRARTNEVIAEMIGIEQPNLV